MSTEDLTISLLARALDVSALRQSVYAANVANAGVEGYQRMDVHFDDSLQRAALEIDQSASLTPVRSADASVISTGTTVRLDEEMGLMAKNALQYQTLIGTYEGMVGLMRVAVREGRE